MPYNNHQKWLKFLFNATTIAFSKPFVLLGMLITGILTYYAIDDPLKLLSLILPADQLANITGALDEEVIPKPLFMVLGIVVGLMLVFRTNTAYDRWWEGRKQLGRLVNTSRNIGFKFHSYIANSDYEHKDLIKQLIVAFALTLKEHLREDEHPDYKDFIPPTLQKDFEKAAHKPNLILLELSRHIKNIFDLKIITGEQLIVLEREITELTDIMGACERIRHTPIPMGYTLFLRLILFIFLFWLPFIFLGHKHGDWITYFAVPFNVLMFYAFIRIAALAEEIEDPFGDDPNDLKVDEICLKIKNNVYEMMAHPMPSQSVFTKQYKEEKVSVTNNS